MFWVFDWFSGAALSARMVSADRMEAPLGERRGVVGEMTAVAGSRFYSHGRCQRVRP